MDSSEKLSWKDIIAPLLKEFQERMASDLHIVRRDTILPRLSGKIDAIIGMRRTGKTYLLLQQIQNLISSGVPPESIFYLNFEDDRLPPVTKGSLTHIVDAFYELYPENHRRECHFFLDEVQNTEDWPRVLRRLLDTRKVRITVTGSSAKLLSREIATSLRGRSLATEVWPFSFTESLKARSRVAPSPPLSPRARDELRKDIETFLKTGGFPETTAVGEMDRRRIHQDYVSVVILKDIVERHKIKNEALLRYFIKMMITQIARPLSLNKIYNDLKSQGRVIGKNTLYQYLDFISDCFLAFSVPLFSESLRKQQSNLRKVYSIDSGLSFSHTLSTSENIGRLFEDLIYVDLRRKGREVYYYLTRNGHEVDFVTRSLDGKFHAYQVCWDTHDPATSERETRALQEAGQELSVKTTLITPENYLEFISEA